MRVDKSKQPNGKKGKPRGRSWVARPEAEVREALRVSGVLGRVYDKARITLAYVSILDR